MSDEVLKPRTAQAKLKDDVCALDARVEGVELELREFMLRFAGLCFMMCLLVLLLLRSKASAR